MKRTKPILIAVLCGVTFLLFLGNHFGQRTYRWKGPETSARWTWPGDGSQQSLKAHLEGFHGEDTSGQSFKQMMERHDSIHDVIGPISFDSAGNAYTPTDSRPIQVTRSFSYGNGSTGLAIRRNRIGPVYSTGSTFNYGSGGGTWGNQYRSFQRRRFFSRPRFLRGHGSRG